MRGPHREAKICGIRDTGWTTSVFRRGGFVSKQTGEGGVSLSGAVATNKKSHILDVELRSRYVHENCGDMQDISVKVLQRNQRGVNRESSVFLFEWLESEHESSGIYKVTCPDCSKIYLGQTKSLVSVCWVEHKREAETARKKKRKSATLRSVIAPHIIEEGESIT